MKLISLFSLLLVILVGCSPSGQTSITSQADAIPLTSSLSTSVLSELESGQHEITFGYPDSWVVAESDQSIYFAPSESQLPWGFEYYSSPLQPYYYVRTMSPYLTRSDRRLHKPRSATEIAQAIADTMTTTREATGKLVEPIRTIDVNGRDGASFLVAVGTLHHYEIVLRVAPDKAVAIVANGPMEKSKEMQAIVNAVALSVQPLQD